MTATLMRDGSTVQDPRLGRLPLFDEKSRNYQVRALLEAAPPVDHRGDPGKAWLPGPTTDQGQEGQCVSEGMHGLRNGSPKREKPYLVAMAERTEFYHQCQHEDPWRGCYLGAKCPIDPDAADAYGGTAVLTGGMHGVKLGWWKEIRWIGAGSGRLEDDLIDTLRTLGPIAFGIPWLDGMYETSPSGLVDVSGKEVGGHCIDGFEWAPHQRMPKHWSGTKPGVWWHNSWGPTYGVKRRGVTGCGFILLDDLLSLVDNHRGEGMVAIK